VTLPGLLEWFRAPFITPPRQWHPILVHFPIVFLFLEAALLFRHAPRPRRELQSAADVFLRLSVWSMIPVAIAGIHDAGLDLGRGNPLWLGLQDRWRNALNLRSSISAHVFLISLLFVLTAVRLIVRARIDPATLEGKKAWIELGLAVLGLVLLVIGTYAAAIVSHP